MYKSFLGFLLLFLMHSCGPGPTAPIGDLDEIRQLETADQKRAYLEEILEADQNVRDSEKEAVLIAKHGYNSDQHMAFIEEQWRQDEQNMVKIANYLSEFSYPNKDSLGKDAAIAPWLVIHHSTDEGLRLSYFGELYSAYLEGNLDDMAFSMYLERTFKMLHDEEIRLEDPYTTDDRIELLIEKLNLTQEKIEAEKKVDSSN